MSVMSEQFAVALTPLPTATRVAKHRSSIRWRVISAIISLAILIAIVVFLIGSVHAHWQGDAHGGAGIRLRDDFKLSAMFTN